MRYVALLASILAFSANAADAVLTADAKDGTHVRIHTLDVGDCVDGGRRAVWVSHDAAKQVEGCWVGIGNGHLVVALRNGMAYIVPLDALKEPKKV